MAIDLSQDHALLAPSLAWSNFLLNGDDSINQQLIAKTDSLLIKSAAPLSRLTFTDLVLLNQLSPYLGVSQEQKQLMMQMTYRHDQMEQKANIADYKKYQGADIVQDFVQSLKFTSFDGSFEISRFNPERNGYMQLLDIDAKTPFTIILDNKMDVLNDITTPNGYEKIRKKQLENACKKDDR